MASDFGDNLKKIRSDKNLSQGDLAQAIGIHASHVSRYERNLTTPSIEALKKIANALDVSTDMLLFGTSEEKAKNNIKDNELLSMFSKVQTLDKGELNCVKSFLRAYTLVADLHVQLPKR